MPVERPFSRDTTKSPPTVDASTPDKTNTTTLMTADKTIAHWHKNHGNTPAHFTELHIIFSIKAKRDVPLSAIKATSEEMMSLELDDHRRTESWQTWLRKYKLDAEMRARQAGEWTPVMCKKWQRKYEKLATRHSGRPPLPAEDHEEWKRVMMESARDNLKKCEDI